MDEELPARSRALTLLRDLRDWTQQQLADVAGLKRGTISDYERGVEVPSLRKLRGFSDLMGHSEETFRDVLQLVRRQAPPRDRWVGPVHFTAEEERESWRLGAAAGRLEALSYRRWLRRARLEQQAAQDRQEAQLLGIHLRAERELLAAIQKEKEYQTWAISELLCQWSIDAAPKDPDQAIELAEAAVVAAELAPGEKRWCLLTQGFAHAHVGNACKVTNNFKSADKAFLRSAVCLKAGHGGDPARLLNQARIFGLEAALRTVQQRVEDALALIAKGLTVSNEAEKPYLLIGRAKALEEREDFEGAIAALREAAPLITEKKSRLAWALQFDLLVYLCRLDRYSEVQESLPEVRGFTMALGNGLDLLRLKWVEGLVQAGTGYREKAVESLSVVRADFTERQLHYDAALVSIDLAEVLLRLRRVSAVKILAEKLAPIFASQGVHANAKKALLLFREAALSEAATLSLVRAVANYLRRARRSPHLEFASLA
ncbi:MAG TPA: helix-turn-helix transcriptional regulator [Thermoanaerobaculia bacterium]|nr:helix-turn-helix transcriptional regulator [Thermoanaerobaculia bacterium]